MARKRIDWEAIEKEYRLGQKSMRTLAVEYNVNVSNISRRAKKYLWSQDKSDEIRQRTQAAIVASDRNIPTPQDIDVAVQTNKQVILSHRKSIGKTQELVDLLSSQLDDAARNRAELEGQVDGECRKKEGGIDYQKRHRLRRALSLPAHASVLRDLSTAQKNLVALERQAFNLDDKGHSTTDCDNVEKININFVTPIDIADGN